MNNVRNYVTLSAMDPEPVKVKGMSLAVNGIGSGLIGLPGDPSPPSRLVRTVTMSHFALPVKDNQGAVNLAEHLLNAVDIPLGLIRDQEADGKVEYDRTLWVVIKDLQAMKLYYRSYYDLAMKVVDLKGLDFSEKGKRLATAVEHTQPTYIDVTSRLK